MHFTILACLSLIAISYSKARNPSSKVLSIPLVRHYKHGSYTMRNVLRSRTLTRSLRNKNNVALHNCADMYYTGPIYVGEPKQRVMIDFDTGSSDLWVASHLMCHTSKKEYCLKHNTYSNYESKTYKKNGTFFQIQYVTGSVLGFFSKDNIEVAGMNVKGQMFGEAVSMDPQTAGTNFDGIMGLSCSSLFRPEGFDGPFPNMMKQKVVEKPIFSFYLNKEPHSVPEHRSAELVFGSMNTDHFTGNMTFTDVIDPSGWFVQVDSVWLGERKISNTTIGLLDSGTSLLVGPPSFIARINKFIGANKDNIVDCLTIASLPDVSFVFNGVHFTLQPQHYILKVAKDDKSDHFGCMSGFDSVPGMSFIIFGDMFMRKYYTVFDMGTNRVGLALAK